MSIQFVSNRRNFLNQSGLALGLTALHGILQSESAAVGQVAQNHTHFAARAKSIIYLHMIGAPSQLDLFEPKPELIRRDGEDCPTSVLEGRRFAFLGKTLKLSGSQFKFDRHGQSGQSFSELLPKLSQVADELCFVRSMHSDEINHAPAQILLHTGFGRGGRPSLGSWVTYGLGSENQNLPSYVVLLSGPAGGAGSSLFSSGFLPTVNQGIQFRSAGDSVLYLNNPPGHSTNSRRRLLNTLSQMNQLHYEQVVDPEIETRISQYEMAYRMQASVPDLMDLTDESAETLQLYGAQPGKATFANNCLLARRLVERGVRMIELYDSDWDHHANLDTRLRAKTTDIDQACAALIQDLKRRDMLKDTLIVWGSEFGRTPIQQGIDQSGKETSPGRDHHKDAFTVWLAGGGIRGGVSYGVTDEFGFGVVEQPVHVHDLNATILYLLGLDHERLTYKFQGREYRLTDIGGIVRREWLS